MKSKKLISTLIILFVSLSLFAGYIHVSFSLSSAISLDKNVRYRFLGTTDWIEIKDKSKVSLCIDPDLDNRIVLEVQEEGESWKNLCTASIVALTGKETEASAKWMWNEFSSQSIGARWSVTGGKWNYIPLSERSVTVENISSGKLTLFTLQSTPDGETWDVVALHGIIPVLYDASLLSEEKCSECQERGKAFIKIEEEEVVEDISLPEPLSEIEEEQELEMEEGPFVENEEASITVKEDTKEEKAFRKNTFYGGYTRRERPLSGTKNVMDGMELGWRYMFWERLGMELSISLDRFIFPDNSINLSLGLTYHEDYSFFFSPYIKAAFGGSLIFIDNDVRFSPQLGLSLGIDYWLNKSFGLYTAFDGYISFIGKEKVDLKAGVSLGGRIRFR